MSGQSSILRPLDWGTFLSTWHPQVGWTSAGLVLLVVYLTGVLRGRRNGLPLAPARVACFVAGILLLVGTVSSAVGAYAMSLFWMHMVEHLTLIMVVPALLVLGHPFTVLRDALAARRRARVSAVYESWPVALVTNPVFGLAAYGATIVGTHLTSFMDQMVHHSWLMTGEQVLYVLAGYLLLLPLIGEEPIRWQLAYLPRIMLLMVAMVPDTVVGIVLLQTDHDLFPAMEAGHPAWAPSAVSDLQTGGALMWAAGDGLMMCIAFGLVLTFVVGPTRDRVLGPWLESVRRQTMADHVALGGHHQNLGDADVDADEAVLESYNRMLARLGDATTESHHP